MVEEKKITEEGIKDIGAYERRRISKKLEKRREKVIEMSLDINRKIMNYSQGVEEVIGSLNETIGKISDRTIDWLKRLETCYVKEERKINEVLDFEEIDEVMIQELQKDLSSILEGLDEEGYKSPISGLKKANEELRQDLKKQKKLTKKETKKREKIEERTKKTKSELNELKEEVEKLRPEVADLEEAVEILGEHKITLRGYIEATFDNPNFHLYMLKELSELNILDKELNFEDEGIGIIFSPEFYSLAENKDFIKLAKEKHKGEAKLKSVRFREQYDQIVEKLSPYIQDSKHIDNLRKLVTGLSKAKQKLKSRRETELFWCGNYSKQCWSICPGFMPDENYCSSNKDMPYDINRSNLLIKLMDKAQRYLQIAVVFEKRLREKK